MLLIEKTIHPEETHNYNEQQWYIVEQLKRNFRQEMREASSNLGTKKSIWSKNKFKTA